MNEQDIIISFDPRGYESEDFSLIQRELREIVNIELKETVHKTLDPVLMVVIVISAFWFSKGFFTKAGEKLGEEVGSDLVRAYKFFRNKIVEILKRPKREGLPSIEVKIYIQDKTQVSGFVKTNNEKILSTFFDSVHDLYENATRMFKSPKLRASEKIVFNFDIEIQNWKPIYFITRNKEVYIFE